MKYERFPFLNSNQHQICSLYGDLKKKKKVRPAYYIKEVGIKSKTKLKTVVTLEEVTRRKREGASGVLVLFCFLIWVLVTKLSP